LALDGIEGFNCNACVCQGKKYDNMKQGN
jgi:hypothetical protein